MVISPAERTVPIAPTNDTTRCSSKRIWLVSPPAMVVVSCTGTPTKKLKLMGGAYSVASEPAATSHAHCTVSPAVADTMGDVMVMVWLNGDARSNVNGADVDTGVLAPPPEVHVKPILVRVNGAVGT